MRVTKRELFETIELLQAEITEALDVLRSVEWLPDPTDPNKKTCPSCKAMVEVVYDETGELGLDEDEMPHEPGCRLDALVNHPVEA